VEDGITGGYVTDLAYAESFFRELSPAWLSYVAALSGVAVRDLATPFTYLELGCGHGQTALINAAAFPHASFHACDLNPAHIAAARRTAAAFAIDNIQFHEVDFAALLDRELPSFDFIVLHGVYSWVDSTARAAVRDILAAKLHAEGLAYVSYNCLPGWASEAPLRKLLVELAASESGDSGQRSARALQALQQLSAGKLQFLTLNAPASAALEAYQRESINYLVHEFMNRSWDLFYGVDVADEMRAIGLEYLGSATLAENHPMLQMDERTANAVAALTTERQQRLAADFATNRRFRRDVFIRGSSVRTPEQVSQQLATTLLGCVRSGDLARSSIRVPRGELTIQADFLRELARVLQPGPVSIADAVNTLHRPGRDPAAILRNLLFLMAAGSLQPCARSAPSTPPGEGLRYANPTVQLILEHGAQRGRGAVVPSAVLGNGIKLQPYEALTVSAMLSGNCEPATLSTWLDQEMARRDVRLAQGQSTRKIAKYTLDEVVPSLVRLGILL
jgi:SAM-dependent methyltransferase